MKTITFHSYKGGTGKTSTVVNMGYLLAQKGRNIALLDFDIRAPTMHYVFPPNGHKVYINDVLAGKAKLNEVIRDFTKDYELAGKLLIGYASSDAEIIRDTMTKDEKWYRSALDRLISNISDFSEEYNLDYVFFDTNPGVFDYNSLNAIVIADIIICILRGDVFDTVGTKEIIDRIYQDRPVYLLANKSPAPLSEGNLQKDYESELERRFGKPVIGVLPCSCDVLFESGLFVNKKPDNPYTHRLNTMIDKLEAL